MALARIIHFLHTLILRLHSTIRLSSLWCLTTIKRRRQRYLLPSLRGRGRGWGFLFYCKKIAEPEITSAPATCVFPDFKKLTIWTNYTKTTILMSNLFPSLGMLFTNLILLKPKLYLYYLWQALKKHLLPIWTLASSENSEVKEVFRKAQGSCAPYGR